MWPTSLFQHTSLLGLALDLAGRFAMVNPAAARLYGENPETLLGCPFTTVLDPFSHAKAAVMLERTLSLGGVTEWELDHLQPHKPPILVAYTTSVLRDEAGEIVGIGAIGRDRSGNVDLTARLAQTNQELEGALLKLEHAHKQVQDAQAQLVQSEKMRTLGQLVAGVAHEINNPSAFVASNLQHLAQVLPRLETLVAAYTQLKPLASPAQAAAITAAEDVAEIDYLWTDLRDVAQESLEGMERIRGIVKSLRSFARLDEAEMKEADLNDGLRSTLRLVRPLCINRIQVTEQYGDLPLVWCRPGELNQVFLNLLTNAVQAIDGPGTIAISTAARENQIVITIRDSGVGMDPAIVARLGEPFFTTKPVGVGTGLGLAISGGIVERHGGRLQFDSAPGHGATAILELPLNND